MASLYYCMCHEIVDIKYCAEFLSVRLELNLEYAIEVGRIFGRTVSPYLQEAKLSLG